METLIQTVNIFNQDKGMEFGIEKFAMLIRKSGIRATNDDAELLNQESIRTL